jgi:hypothetical protein
MLPLITLRHSSTGALDFDPNELIRKADEYQKRRLEVDGYSEPQIPEMRRNNDVPDAVLKAREMKSRRDAAEEVRKMGAGVFENASETEEASSGTYTDESDNDSDFGPDDGAAVFTRSGFDDADDSTMLRDVDGEAVSKFVTIEDIESIIGHMREALELVKNAMKDAPPDESTQLFGVSVRLRQDIGMLRGLINRMTGNRSGMLIRSRKVADDVRQVDRRLQAVSTRPMVVQRMMDSIRPILPVLSMLVYLLAMYYAPGMALPFVEPNDIPIVYPPNHTGPIHHNVPAVDVIEPVEEMPFVPNVTPTQLKKAKGILHKMVQKDM